MLVICQSYCQIIKALSHGHLFRRAQPQSQDPGQGGNEHAQVVDNRKLRLVHNKNSVRFNRGELRVPVN